ncbi:Uncharacterised protein [Vibrio cholerae]|nr:Uncharacterised protein [Vibrio cholerae]
MGIVVNESKQLRFTLFTFNHQHHQLWNGQQTFTTQMIYLAQSKLMFGFESRLSYHVSITQYRLYLLAEFSKQLLFRVISHIVNAGWLIKGFYVTLQEIGKLYTLILVPTR